MSAEEERTWYRVIVLPPEDWKPEAWDHFPPRAKVLGVIGAAGTRRELRERQQAFNSDELRERTGLWMIVVRRPPPAGRHVAIRSRPLI